MGFRALEEGNGAIAQRTANSLRQMGNDAVKWCQGNIIIRVIKDLSKLKVQAANYKQPKVVEVCQKAIGTLNRSQ